MMPGMRTFLGSVAIVLSSTSLRASDLDKAPPSFEYQNRRAVFADFSNVSLAITFNVKNKRALGHAKIEFQVKEAGMPIFDLVPPISDVKLNGDTINLADIYETSDPDEQSNVSLVGVEVAPGQRHTLEISYDLSQVVNFGNGTVGAGFFMNDLADREFFEKYAPSNFEYDQYKQILAVEIIGAQSAHEVFANGIIQETGENKWVIDYPAYFTTSSFYFHLAAKGRFNVVRFNYPGIKANIPLTVYSASSNDAARGMNLLKGFIAELESTFGAFAHPSFIAYITSSGGGMEYCGATVSSLNALGHETTHSWFARGVMPASGNSGWLDEAIASWRDNNYPRSQNPVRMPRNLSGFSPYKRFTTMDAYSYGANLMSDFDGLIAPVQKQGLRSVLHDFYGKYQHQTITVATFQSHLEQVLGYSLQDFFDKYVYHKSYHFDAVTKPAGWDVDWSRHPRPFTPDELKQLR